MFKAVHQIWINWFFFNTIIYIYINLKFLTTCFFRQLKSLVVQALSCVQLFCDPIYYSLPGFSVHDISQARILEWVAISFSRVSSWPRDPPQVSCIGRQILCHWATWALIAQLVNHLGPNSSAGKDSACNAGDPGSIPVLGRSPGEEKGYPHQYSGLQNSMDCIVHRFAKSWTRLIDFHFSHLGNPATKAVDYKIYLDESKISLGNEAKKKKKKGKINFTR